MAWEPPHHPDKGTLTDTITAPKIATRNDLLKVQLRRNQYRADMVDLDNGIELFGSLLGQYIGLPENVRPAAASNNCGP